MEPNVPVNVPITNNPPTSKDEAKFEQKVDDFYNNFNWYGFTNPGQKSKERTEWYKDKVERTYNERQAREERAWQEMMSNTAVQRRAKDLQDAGFNPMLAILSQTMGAASTPTVSQNRWNHKSRMSDKATEPKDLFKHSSDKQKEDKSIISKLLGLLLFLG